MTQIQGYQINLPSISGYMQQIAVQVATGALGTGSLIFYLNTNPSGFIQDTGQFYPIDNPSGYVTSVQTGTLTGTFYPLNTNPNSYITGTHPSYYFGYSGFNITGTQTITNGLLFGQGQLTNKINVTSGASSFLATINVPLTNSFPGAIQKYLVSMPATTNSNFQIKDSVNNQVLVGQSGQSDAFNTYIEIACSGNGWYLNQWA